MEQLAEGQNVLLTVMTIAKASWKQILLGDTRLPLAVDPLQEVTDTLPISKGEGQTAEALV